MSRVVSSSAKTPVSLATSSWVSCHSPSVLRGCRRSRGVKGIMGWSAFLVWLAAGRFGVAEARLGCHQKLDVA